MLESKSNRIAKLSNSYVEKFRKARLKYQKRISDMRDYIKILEENKNN